MGRMSLSGEPTIILGSYRSGTSSLAATLVHLGLYMGTKEALFPADEFNPDGHWELLEMMALHEKLLMGFRSTYFAATSLPENWREHPLRETMVRDVWALLEKHFRSSSNWGWKEPSTSILLPLYQEALAQSGLSGRYVICVRHPKAVVASMMKRFVSTPLEMVNSGTQVYPGAEERLMAMWVSYTLAALADTKGRRRMLISYERYLKEPRKYLQGMAERLLDWTPSAEQMETAVASVNPRLSHSSFDPSERMLDWPEIVNETYDLCLRIDEDPAGFQAGAFDQEIDSLWRKWLRERRMINPITLPSAQLEVTWSEGGEPKRFSEGFVPTVHGDEFEFRVNAPAATEVTIDAFQMPCQIWIKDAAWVGAGGRQKAQFKAGPGGILEEISGAQRLTVFGPASLLGKTPEGDGPFSLSLKILVQYDQAALTRAVGLVGRQLANR